MTQQQDIPDLIAGALGVSRGTAYDMMREALAGAQQQCWCTTCRPITLTDMRFVVCPECGNKRCPKANDHRNACTGSNDVGQKGSSWEHVKPVSEQPAQQQEPYPVEEMQDEILRLSEIIITNAFYQAGRADALEWAAQMAVLEDPRTSDWVYDDPHELAKALRKGPDFETSPPASKPWVGLTLDDHIELARAVAVNKYQIRAIEAKLREKNA